MQLVIVPAEYVQETLKWDIEISAELHAAFLRDEAFALAELNKFLRNDPIGQQILLSGYTDVQYARNMVIISNPIDKLDPVYVLALRPIRGPIMENNESC